MKYIDVKVEFKSINENDYEIFCDLVEALSGKIVMDVEIGIGEEHGNDD